MPQLGEYRFILNNVGFLYRTAEQAAQGRKAGGTGFFIALPSQKAPDRFHHIYLATNFHVAKAEPRTLRVKTRDGRTDLIAISSWVSTPGGPDVAIAPMSLDPARHVVEALRADSWFLTREDFSRLEIDVGDDVFMVGRFVDHDGGQTNQPSARFGHISMTNAAVQQVTGFTGGSFVVDMHSRTGYSGSPVFVYRTGGSIFAKPNTIMAGGHLMKLLGIHWGQFPERWELSNAQAQSKSEDEAEVELITDGQYVKGLSGMTCVVPAWDILDVLNRPELVDQRARTEAALKL